MKKRVLIVGLTAVLINCGRLSLARRGRVEIVTSGGKVLYVHRLARGIAYDVLWLTASSMPCRLPSSDKDIVLPSQAGVPLYFHLAPDGAVVLYGYGRVKVPIDFPLRIRQEIVHPVDWAEVVAKHARGEVRMVNVELSEDDNCIVRW